MPEKINIGFGIDKNFGKFAGITITSLAHNNIGHELVVHIIYDELLPEDLEKLLQTEALYRNLTLRFYQIKSTEGMTFVVPPGHITQAMYYRYLFADMLPREITKIIYLDADIICKGDILPLWQTDLQGRVLGAVRDYGEDRSSCFSGWKPLAIPKSSGATRTRSMALSTASLPNCRRFLTVSLSIIRH